MLGDGGGGVGDGCQCERGDRPSPVVAQVYYQYRRVPKYKTSLIEYHLYVVL